MESILIFLILGIGVVCAVNNSTIGIDIELIKPIDFKIPERFFSKNELNKLIQEEPYESEIT